MATSATMVPHVSQPVRLAPLPRNAVAAAAIENAIVSTSGTISVPVLATTSIIALFALAPMPNSTAVPMISTRAPSITSSLILPSASPSSGVSLTDMLSTVPPSNAPPSSIAPSTCTVPQGLFQMGMAGSA